MAAPNFVGPDPGHDSAVADAVAGPVSLDDRARAAHIAELAERLAAIEARDRAAGKPAPDRSARRRESGPQTSARQAGPVGSSGTSRRRTESGGHPEDAPGDPAVVARSICLRLLTGAPRPRAALEKALRLKEIPDDVAASVLDRLTEVGLIDDRAYAEAFVATKHRDRALGASALRMELRRKGVDEVTVEAAVQTVDSDAERDCAQALIERRVDAAMGYGPVAARRRLIGLLARRGYSTEISSQVVDEALAAYGAEQDEGWS